MHMWITWPDIYPILMIRQKTIWISLMRLKSTAQNQLDQGFQAEQNRKKNIERLELRETTTSRQLVEEEKP